MTLRTPPPATRSLRHACLAGLALVATCPSAGAPPTDDPVAAQLRAAATEATMFGFGRAFELAEAARARTEPSSEPWQRAVFLAALCAQQAAPPTPAMIHGAEARYRLLLEKTPDSPYAPRALMNLGRIAEVIDYYGDRPDLEAARRRYLQIVQRWPNLPIAGEATLRAATTHIQTFEPAQLDEGIALLEAWLAAHPKDELASAMWQYLGDVWFYPRANHERSLSCYEQADRIGLLDRGRAGPLYWRMAVMADRHLRDRGRAVTYYTKVIERAPASGKAYEAQLALRRLGAPVPKIRLFELMGETEGASRE